MSEQVEVQVREGVWRTRGGEQVEVRARDTTAFETEWRWYGERYGHMVTWRDDGTIHIERRTSNGDLMQFLRPLPEPEPEPEPAPEPQPVKLRAGIWKTRSGHEVEVRENSGQLAKDFPWRGALFDVVEIWRNNGQWLNNATCDHRDLVEYVGPLPAVETRTDTLAEIEEQTCETLQEALGRALEQAYIADLKKAIDAVTAERDRLQQAHQTMTEHARELLESRQQARDERDTLAQRLVAMTSERDEVANELRAMTDHCSRQQEQLQALTEKREQLTVLLSNAQCAHDVQQGQVQRLQAELTAACELLQSERFEAQQTHAGCKRAEEHLEEVTAERDRLTNEVTNAQRLAADLRGEVDFVRGQKTAQEHQLRAEIARLEQGWRQAQIDLDAERETPAANCKAIVDAHLIGAQSGRQAAFEAVERWLEPLAGVDSEHAAAVLQALPGCIRKLAELEGVTW